MDQILEFFSTPEILVLIAYLAGAAIIGATILVCVMFVADFFGWLS